MKKALFMLAGAFAAVGLASGFSAGSALINDASYASSTPEQHLYITGDGDFVNGSWNPSTPGEFEYVDGNYTITVENLSQFKISTACGDWDAFNGAALWCEYGTEQGVEVALMPRDDLNIQCPARATWTITVTGDLSTIKLTTDDSVVIVPIEDTPLYIRGNMNGWVADENWKLKKLGKDSDGAWIYSYTICETGIPAGEDFKIADADWAKVNIGGVGDYIMLDSETEVYNVGNPINLYAEEYVDGMVYLKINYTNNEGYIYLTNDDKAPCPFPYEGDVLPDPKPTSGFHMFINGKEVANGSRINITSFYEDQEYQFMIDPKMTIKADESGSFNGTVKLTQGETIPEWDWDFGAQVNALWCAFDGQCVPLSTGQSANKSASLTAGRTEDMQLEISGMYGDQQDPSSLTVKAECTFACTFGGKAYSLTLYVDRRPSVIGEKHLYIVGNGDFVNGPWNPESPEEFKYLDGTYTITVENLSQFKISTAYGDWYSFNAEALWCDYGTEQGVEVALVPRDDFNIQCPTRATWTITVAGDLSTIKLTTDDPVVIVPIEDTPIYIRGDMNGWVADENWKLKKLGKDSEGAWVYSYAMDGNVIPASEMFKIADETWGEVNIGGEDNLPVMLDTKENVYNGGNPANLCAEEDVDGMVYLKINYASNEGYIYLTNDKEARCPFSYEGYVAPGTPPDPDPIVGSPIENIEDICDVYTISENWFWPLTSERPDDPTFTISHIKDNFIAISCSGIEVDPIKASVDLKAGTITINAADNKNLAYMGDYDEDTYLELRGIDWDEDGYGEMTDAKDKITIPVLSSGQIDFTSAILLWRISTGYFYGIGNFYLTKTNQDPQLKMFINGQEVENGSRVDITSFFEDEEYQFMVDPKMTIKADKSGSFTGTVTLTQGETIPEFDWDFGAQVNALWCAFDGQCVPLSVGKSYTKSATLTAGKTENMQLEISGMYGDQQNPEELSVKAECTLNFTFGGKDYTLTLYVDKQAQGVNEKHLYITGDGDFEGGQWTPENADEFEFVNGNYVKTVENLSVFKISTARGDWDVFNAGGLYCDYGSEPGVDVMLEAGDYNIQCPVKATWTITIAGDLSTIKLTTDDPVVVVPIEDEPIYLRGDMNEWTAADEWRLTRLGKDSEGAWVYSYLFGDTGISSNSNFKIADADWNKINIGSAGENVTPEMIIEAANGANPLNFIVSEDITGIIYLKVNYSDNSAALFASNDKEAPCPFDYEGRPTPAPVMVNVAVSDGTSFGYKVAFGAETEFNIALADDYWKLTSYSLNGTKYDIADPSASYKCEFTAKSKNDYMFFAEYAGILEVVENSGVAALENKVTITVSDDTVEIRGIEIGTSVAVYTLGGQTIMARIAADEVMSIRLDKGQTYVVRAGEAAVKVIL
ncbi:MAG: hypothetical protein K2G23_04325 [Muribaculaceae bacterium]|nr:hypothetical protein [Muribaculaceae bacterium]